MNGGSADRFDLGPDADELAGIARELVAFGDETRLAPPPDLVDRVMAVVATEPVPTPPVTFLHAVGALALVDAWRAWRLNVRVALGTGRAPGRLRIQALAVVVVAALLVGLGGTTVVVGAAQFVRSVVAPSISDQDTTPVPSRIDTSPTPSPQPSTTTPEITVPSAPSTSPDASEDPGETAEPGNGSESSEDPGASSGSSTTPRPARTPRPTETPETGDGGEHEDGTPKPSDTPRPSDTPEPTSTSNSGSSGAGTDD